MSNFLKGMGSIFNLFPETDYMAMVPKEGELLELSARDVRVTMNEAYESLAQQYGYSVAPSKKVVVLNERKSR
ncbi:hypothetical protein EBI01_20245 [Marinomonas rhizomae]|uniref:Uncharacterized protein n=1 Tax=Marinomonas rhizomae TaxID=491948 RepID=A0A366IYC9_9GAMM|nr:hypothetical protein [Marinomonas rhizomae]RBP79089.1 hypothetical protein DFP80_11519 [Marinomonas rhizomae]RNF68568.1 hypothetical protein EBI01_20245 [Marinomonas rhizomae]